MAIGLPRFATIFAFGSNFSIGAWIALETTQGFDQARETLMALGEAAWDLSTWIVIGVFGFIMLRGVFSFPFARDHVQSSSTSHGAFRNGGVYPWP